MLIQLIKGRVFNQNTDLDQYICQNDAQIHFKHRCRLNQYLYQSWAYTEIENYSFTSVKFQSNDEVKRKKKKPKGSNYKKVY